MNVKEIIFQAKISIDPNKSVESQTIKNPFKAHPGTGALEELDALALARVLEGEVGVFEREVGLVLVLRVEGAVAPPQLHSEEGVERIHVCGNHRSRRRHGRHFWLFFGVVVNWFGVMMVMVFGLFL